MNLNKIIKMYNQYLNDNPLLNKRFAYGVDRPNSRPDTVSQKPKNKSEKGRQSPDQITRQAKKAVSESFQKSKDTFENMEKKSLKKYMQAVREGIRTLDQTAAQELEEFMNNIKSGKSIRHMNDAFSNLINEYTDNRYEQRKYVKALQLTMKQEGVFNGVVDGLFGPRTGEGFKKLIEKRNQVEQRQIAERQKKLRQYKKIEKSLSTVLVAGQRGVFTKNIHQGLNYLNPKPLREKALKTFNKAREAYEKYQETKSSQDQERYITYVGQVAQYANQYLSSLRRDINK